ncbi:hypothetical protein [Actinoplanes sp. NPDC051851]|uniref:hypothetical protein n=1 Tax=Actinoplanes sp. NPDC051851 TaxID=3154753 RepID=UPI0034301C42
MQEIALTVVSLVLGAVAGLYLTVRYEDAWKARRNRRRRLRASRSIRRDRLHDEEAVSVGGRLTGFHLVEGDGQAVLEPENVVIDLRAGTREPPPAVVALRQRIRRQLNAARRSPDDQVTGWNSTTLVSLDGYRVSRSPDREDIVLHLETHTTDYATFAATALSLDEPIPVTDIHGVEGVSTLRHQFFPTRQAIRTAIRHPDPDLSNGIGIALLVFTDDDRVVLSRRRQSSRARPGERDVTVVEGLHAHRDLRGSGRLDVYQAAIRGCMEELGVSVRADDVRVLGFGVDMQFYQWNFLGLVRLRGTAAELFEAHAISARDRWEGRLESFPADPELVFSRLGQDGAWDTALVTAFLAFSHVHGAAATRRAAERALGRPA